MIDYSKMRNQFNISCGYMVGLVMYFNRKAEWYIYYLVTTTTDPPSEP